MDSHSWQSESVGALCPMLKAEAATNKDCLATSFFGNELDDFRLFRKPATLEWRLPDPGLELCEGRGQHHALSCFCGSRRRRKDAERTVSLRKVAHGGVMQLARCRRLNRCEA